MATYKSNIPGFKPVIIEGYTDFADYYTSCEMQTKEWLINVLKSDSTFIDVGANVGILSLTAGKKIGRDGKIVSIEPTNTYSILKKNLANQANNHETPTLFVNKAISDQIGMRKDRIFKIWGKNPELSTWDFTTIDQLVVDYGLERVDVMKVDTDGYELEVLKGAIKTLNQFYPIVIVEINEALTTRGVTPDKIFDFFLDQRYTNVILLDDFNYAFSSNWQIGDVWPISLELTRWRKDSSIALEKGEIISRNFKIHIANKKVKCNSVNSRFSSAELSKWNYVVDLECEDNFSSKPITLEIEGIVHEGRVSCAVLDFDYKTVISNEDYTEEPGKFKLIVKCDRWTNKVVLRTISDSPFDFEIHSISMFEGVSAENLESELKSIWDGRIQVLSTESDLSNWLQAKVNQSVEDISFPFNHNGWLMEQSSSSHIVTITKSFTKPKFLEIGTWEGFTASLLLKNTDAVIWTMDQDYLIDNEIYPSRYETLSKTHQKEVGWLYKSLDYSSRVNQIYSNSQTYDWNKFPNEMFDVVFIDGNHSEIFVKSDTFSTFSKLKVGGICIWDDFNFDGSNITEAETGVVNFVKVNINWLKSKFDLAYIRGSQFLIGKKISKF